MGPVIELEKVACKCGATNVCFGLRVLIFVFLPKFRPIYKFGLMIWIEFVAVDVRGSQMLKLGMLQSYAYTQKEATF